MASIQKKANRRSNRLKGYDYTQPGAYFVTVCTVDHRNIFGEIMGGDIHLNVFGRIVRVCWLWLSNHYKYVELDQWILMPNHIHGILTVSGRRGGSRTAPTNPPRKPLGRLIGAFKTVSSKWINEIRASPGIPLWQRNYYDRVIRNQGELDRIRQYIDDNPQNWELDKYYRVFEKSGM
ncbi:MAG: transposase [Anaerolineales bacterium]|nr:transposase [Anaerolineales bacterium]